jgi:hypothetical protein
VPLVCGINVFNRGAHRSNKVTLSFARTESLVLLRLWSGYSGTSKIVKRYAYGDEFPTVFR